MRIIGFDYDTKQVAWAIIESKLVKQKEQVKITTEYFKYSNLKELFNFINKSLEKTQPWMVALEGVYLQSNSQVLTRLANIQGIIRLSAYQFNACEPSIITPEEAKRVIGIDIYRKPYRGSSTIEKKQLVISQVNKLLSLKISIEHEADAVAVAYKVYDDFRRSR